MLCVEFPQVYYIDLIEIVHVLKAVAVATSEDLSYQRFLWSVSF